MAWTTAASTLVPALAGAPVAVPNTKPGLLDGVQDGAFRFLGVKRGTIIIGGAGSEGSDVLTAHLTAPLLPTRATMHLRLAGHDRLFTPAADVIDSLPPGGPKLRGILCEGGAVWLPIDGSETYFSSGKR